MAQTGFPSIPAGFKQNVVTCNSNIATELILANSFRDSFIITNIGNTEIYINYGLVCSDIIYICKLSPNAFMSDDFGGIVTGYSENNVGYALVTEKE